MSKHATPNVRIDATHLGDIAARGAARAAEQLTEMLGRPISVEATGMHYGDSARLMPLVGGADAAVTAVYLAMGDEIRGHIMLLFTVEQAHQLVDQLLEQEPGTTKFLDPMAESALGEVGSITSAAFLNELGDAAGIQIHPSPPTVVVDLAGALVDSVLTEISQLGGELLVVETGFRQGDTRIDGFILLTPEPSSLRLLLERLRKAV